MSPELMISVIRQLEFCQFELQTEITAWPVGHRITFKTSKVFIETFVKPEDLTVVMTKILHAIAERM